MGIKDSDYGEGLFIFITPAGPIAGLVKHIDGVAVVEDGGFVRVKNPMMYQENITKGAVAGPDGKNAMNINIGFRPPFAAFALDTMDLLPFAMGGPVNIPQFVGAYKQSCTMLKSNLVLANKIPPGITKQ